MRVAVDARFLTEDDYAVQFLKNVFYILAQDDKQHQFVFFVDSNYSLPASLPNIIAVPFSSSLSFFTQFKWHFFGLAFVLKKYRADVLVTLNGKACFTHSLPQVVIINNLHLPSAGFGKFFRERLTKASLAKAKRIGTSSGFIKNAIVEQYKLRDEKVKVTGISASAVFKPLNWEKREEIKEKYAQGCEYFIYRSVFTADGNLLNTLKAFSIFKKWQKTNMKLLIAGKIDKEDNKHLGKLSTYKYRNEIILLPALTEPELADVLGAAYAMLFLPLHPGFEMPVVEALRCELPLIISIHNSFAELAGEAALYANPANPAEISEQMKKIFKDEPLRARLIENGKHKTESHNWQNVRQAVWQLIEQSVSP